MRAIFLLFTTSLMVGLSGALTPGPVSMLTISQSARYGFWAGPLVTLGHAAAELAMVVALAFGLGRLFQRNLVAGLIGLLGGGFLLWMGLDMARSAWQGMAFALEPEELSGFTGLGTVAAGFLVSVSNPYWLVWWASVGGSYVVLALERGGAGIGAFFGGHLLSDLSWNSFLAFLIVSGSQILHQSLYRGFLFICGLFLVGLSIYFIYSGLRFLRGKKVAQAN